MSTTVRGGDVKRMPSGRATISSAKTRAVRYGTSQSARQGWLPGGASTWTRSIAVGAAKTPDAGGRRAGNDQVRAGGTHRCASTQLAEIEGGVEVGAAYHSLQHTMLYEPLALIDRQTGGLERGAGDGPMMGTQPSEDYAVEV